MSDLSIVELAVPGTQPEYHFPAYVSSIARSDRYLGMLSYARGITI
jgi:hypothetical protein